MTRLYLILTTLIIALSGCNPRTDFRRYIPEKVDKFSRDFISEIHKGNIDSCLSFVLPGMNNDSGRVYLERTYSNISNLELNSCSIISAKKSSYPGKDRITNYSIGYEYAAGDKFLYFSIGVREQKERLTITSFIGTIKEESLSQVNEFTFKDKGFTHYLFLIFTILIPAFIVLTIIYAAVAKIKMKWLWLTGMLFGFMKFSINWTTGQIGYKLLSFSILGSGFIKSGSVTPWILSFSIPVVAIAFWIMRRRLI